MRSDDNIDRLISCLVELDARRTTEPDLPPAPPSAADLAYRIEQFDSPAGAIDVVFEAERIGGYDRLIAHATAMNIDGVPVRIADLDD
ncbi:hypothetical protein BH23ACT9_BH23ACT9_40120 [soil metagenome]